jgi:uncharacterized protein YgiM (DUF1202 family)
MSTKTGIVTADLLNVRSESSVYASILCQLIKGTQINLHRKTGDWIELDMSSLQGYLNRNYTVLNATPQEERGGVEYGIVEAEALNLRSGPGYEYQTVTIVPRGTAVEILEKKPEWLFVQTRPLKGFLQTDLLVEVIGGAPTGSEFYLAVVNEKVINLRSGPGSDNPVITVLAKDTQVHVHSSSSGWAQISTVVKQGYLRKEFVKASAPSTVGSDSLMTATITTDQLSLRKGPGDSFSSLAFLSSGTQVKVLDLTASWLRVQLLKQPGYAYGNYVQEISGKASSEIPASGDPLKPPAYEVIPILGSFSTEQKTMANTWNQYGGLIKQVSAQFSLNPIIALAVLCVESGGKGFGSDGRMIIRFENHYFYNYWGSKNESLYQRHFRYDSSKAWRNHEYRLSPSSAWMPVHTGQQSDEWQVFQFASQFDRTAAMKSISMGSPQIMGANHSILTYASVDQMYYDFQSDIRNQIIGLFRFIQGKSLVPVLIAEDFVSFARVYNGPANASTYGSKIKKHVDEFRLIFSFS